jgi:hypothetical protein
MKRRWLRRTPAPTRKFLLKMLPKNSIGAEIGVHRGDFADRILRIVDPKELHLIDPWRHPWRQSDTYKECAQYGGKVLDGQTEMDSRFEADIHSGRVTVHRGYSSDVLAEFPDGYFDWVYIDGNHLYDFVKQDLELSFKKTKPGGYIAGDDYREDRWWRENVKKAVDEFTRGKRVRVITIRNYQFVLRK